ncbi:MAG TPA: hypothetical protein VFE22_07495, partial [Edaphobacter sp.]|nr:hypothetical protein [Edaphobacter sp.]
MVRKTGAAICFVSSERHVRIMPEMGIERIGKYIRTGKTLPDNERRRDDEDQALRNPENCKDLQKQSAHMLVPSIRNGSMKHKLVSGSTNRSDAVFAMAIGGKFPAKTANMHVE